MRINLIEDVAVEIGGEEIKLVPSRKTRALMAFLLLTGRAHRRETLCEMFFSNTNDPRAALRWSLTKLRPILNHGIERLIATSTSVQINLDGIDLDTQFVRSLVQEPAPCLDEMRRGAALLSCQPFLGLELSHADDYALWLMSEREQLQILRGSLFRRLIETIPEQEALKWLRVWSRLDTYSHEAPRLLSGKLTELGLHQEAAAVLENYKSNLGGDAIDLQRPAYPSAPKDEQVIGFCKATDGVKIAYASVGRGPPLVKAANWLNHLELDWDSPIWGDTFQALAQNHNFIRYDERGNGLSDWEVQDISFDAFVEDLELVVDHLGLTRFPLLGLSQGCAVSIEYAVRHPEKVSALVLIGGYAAGWRLSLSEEEKKERDAVMTLTRAGWGTSNPAYRHIFSQTFMPNADPDRLAWFDDFQRQTTSPENAVRFQEAFGDIDVRHRLKEVSVPTLVVHARNDQRIPLSAGRELAAGIAHSEFIALDSESHIILGDEPAWQVCMDKIDAFLALNAVR